MIGEVVNPKKEKTKLYFSTYVGDGEVEVESKKFNIELRTSIINCPIIKFKDKEFILKWEDIIKLAKDAGLFNDDQKEEK